MDKRHWITLAHRNVLTENDARRRYTQLRDYNNKKIKINSVVVVRKGTIPIERPTLSTKLVPTFAGRGCCVVSATNSHGR
jgi:hypothetical protein